MVTDKKGIGEWGFSALVEAGDKRILFDSGNREETVIQNAEELGIDLSDVTDIILSHHHDDHTGGWRALRQQFGQSNPESFATAHVADGFFLPRMDGDSVIEVSGRLDSAWYANDNGRIAVHRQFDEIYPGIWLTGPVLRKSDEKNYPAGNFIQQGSGFIEDNVPEDQSLVLETKEGLVLVSGCGHAGLINTLNHVQNKFSGQPVTVCIGGFHLLGASESSLAATAEQMKKSGVSYFMGSHCTGLEAVYQFRRLNNMPRERCVVGTVGATFETGKGITTGKIAQ